MTRTRTTALAFLAVLLAAPSATHAQSFAARALTSTALRAAPQTTARSLATVGAGATVTLANCASGWCRTTHDGRTGYVRGRYFRAERSNSSSTASASAAPGAQRRPSVGTRRTPAHGARAAGRRGSSAGGSAPRLPAGSARGYYVGPRGGCYTYSASGRKRYVPRSYCG